MKAKMTVLSIVLLLYSGCAVVPVLVGTGGTAAYFYFQEKAEGVYGIPLDEAYPIAVRTLDVLDLEIVEIETGDDRRILSAKDSIWESREVAFSLEAVGAGFTKATIRATNHTVIPDRAYGKMVLEMFTYEVVQSLDRDKDGKVLLGRR